MNNPHIKTGTRGAEETQGQGGADELQQVIVQRDKDPETDNTTQSKRSMMPSHIEWRKRPAITREQLQDEGTDTTIQIGPNT